MQLIQNRRSQWWRNQFQTELPIGSSGNDFTQEMIDSIFRNLSILYLPLRLPYSCVYFQDGDSHIIYQNLQRKENVSDKVIIFGPGPNNVINYLTQFEGYGIESFAHTQKHEYYFRKYPLTYPKYSGYDRGHRIDLHDTLQQQHNSNDAVLNYVPQVGPYNRALRMHMVKKLRKDGGMYREIPLYTSSSQKLVQCESGLSKSVNIPYGYIFESITANKSKLYYFPNEITAYSQWTGTQLELANKYQIKNSDLYRLTVHMNKQEDDLQTPLLAYTCYYRALNLLGVTPWTFKHITASYSWCSNYGYAVPGRYSLCQEPTLEWSGTSDVKMHYDIIIKYFSLKLLEEAAKYEVCSINFRLTLVQLLNNFFGSQDQKNYWLKNIEHFLKEVGSVNEILQTIEFVFENKTEFEQEIETLVTILEDVIHSERASVEDQLSAHWLTKTYNLRETPLLFTSVAPHNSRIIQQRIARESDLNILLDLSEQKDLVEFDLEGLDLEFDEESWKKRLCNTDHPEYYSFPNYIGDILDNLQKYSPSLKKLSLSGLRFKGNSAPDRFLFSLALLPKGAFPCLEQLDLSDNGLSDSHNFWLSLCLLNFPSLKKLNLCFNQLIDTAEIEEIAERRNICVLLSSQYVESDYADSFASDKISEEECSSELENSDYESDRQTISGI